jgi:chromosome segregation ATPase
MTHPTINDLHITEKYCPCDWKNALFNNSGLVTFIKVAISIAGIATMIFLQSYGGTIGFVLFGASALFDQFFGGDKEIVDLTQEVHQAEQQLLRKQDDIKSLTKQLASLETNSRAAHVQFQNEIAQFKTSNDLLHRVSERYRTEQESLKSENESLSNLSKVSAMQIAKLTQTSESLERKIQTFVTHNQQFIPQIDRLSEVSSHLQSSQQGFRETVGALDQEFDKDLLELSHVLQTMSTKNQQLSEQIKHLESSLSEGGTATAQLIAQSQQFHQDRGAVAKELEQLTQLRNDLIVRESAISQQTAELKGLLAQVKQEKRRLAEG